jgi:NADH dehydrogenase/NADH:ubiquinone oxidoreductase subunit G
MSYDEASDRYVPISWAEAFELVGATLRRLESPHQASFCTSGRLGNEATFLYQLWVREYGTNNLPDCSNMCHEASGRALKASLGTGKGTTDLKDWEEAEAIFLIGVKRREQRAADAHIPDGSRRTVNGYRAVAYGIPSGCVAGYMPELNVLCPIGDVSAQSDQPLMKHLVVEIAASGA